MLRIHDVARTELGAANSDTLSRLNGNPAVSIGIYLAPGANAVQTSARVGAALKELSARFPESIKARVFYDSSSFVSSTINEVVKTLAIAFVSGGRGGVRLPRQPACDDYSDGRDPGQLDRHVRGPAGLWIFRQHNFSAGDGAGDRRRS